MTHTLEYIAIEYSHTWHAWMMYHHEHEQELMTLVQSLVHQFSWV